jgi:hypothetical protein
MSLIGTEWTCQRIRRSSENLMLPLKPSACDPQRLLRLVLLQRYRQPTQTEGSLKSDLSSLQLQNYSVRVL